MQVERQTSNAYRNAQAMAIASASAAIVDAFISNPFQVVRTRMMVHAQGTVLDALRAVRPGEVMRGIGPQLYSLMPRRMWAYTAHQALSRDTPLARFQPETLRAAVAGVLVGVGEGLIFTPTRQISIRQQLYKQAPASIAAHVRAIAAEQGLAGLWRGAVVNAARTGCAGGAYFGSIAATASLWPDAPNMVRGAAGAVASTLASCPLDVVLTRVYANPGSHWATVARDIMAREGPRGFFRGASVGMARGVPSAAINYALTMFSYEAVRNMGRSRD